MLLSFLSLGYCRIFPGICDRQLSLQYVNNTADNHRVTRVVEKQIRKRRSRPRPGSNSSSPWLSDPRFCRKILPLIMRRLTCVEKWRYRRHVAVRAYLRAVVNWCNRGLHRDTERWVRHLWNWAKAICHIPSVTRQPHERHRRLRSKRKPNGACTTSSTTCAYSSSSPVW